MVSMVSLVLPDVYCSAISGNETRANVVVLPNVLQSPTSVLQLPTKFTLFSANLAIRGYQFPKRSATPLGWDRHLVSKRKRRPARRSQSCRRPHHGLAPTKNSFSISLSICCPSWVPYISDDNAPLRPEGPLPSGADRASVEGVVSEPKANLFDALSPSVPNIEKMDKAELREEAIAD